MKTEIVKITEIQKNPDNPRLIKDSKFEKLVKSIKEFPEMLNLRPIVVNNEMVVLGGNMRLSACKEAGLKKIASRAKTAVDTLISSLPWKDYMLAGFSVSLCQMTSSLYIISRINQKFPQLTMVIGGSTFSAMLAGNFFKIFPAIDIVINGEGELPLSQLVGC